MQGTVREVKEMLTLSLPVIAAAGKSVNSRA